MASAGSVIWMMRAVREMLFCTGVHEPLPNLPVLERTAERRSARDDNPIEAAGLGGFVGSFEDDRRAIAKSWFSEVLP